MGWADTLKSIYLRQWPSGVKLTLELVLVLPQEIPCVSGPFSSFVHSVLSTVFIIALSLCYTYVCICLPH